MNYSEELNYTQEILANLSFGNVFEVERVVFIDYGGEYMAYYVTDKHLDIYNKIINSQHELSLN